MALVGEVVAVLDEYKDYLPLTIRQVFYRLVGTSDYEKSERGYERLCETLNRARRAELIPFTAIRDDGTVASIPYAFESLEEFWSAVADTAESYRRERLEGQPRHVEVWVEAAGMVPQIARVAHQFGIAVYSSSGFDSLTVKWEAARRMLRRDTPTVVLHVGDHDPSGVAVFQAAAEDVAALLADQDSLVLPEFVRVAVTPEQIARYGLPEVPAKAHDRRGSWAGGGTVQAEALSPADLAAEIKGAIESEIDASVLETLLELEASERSAAIEQAEGLS